jgi:peptidoglycan/LPS O-acetylase OafA/YrhL
MELTLNILWFAVAVATLVYNRNRPRRVLLALLCAVALLFPIISVSDDLNQSRTFNEPAAAVAMIMVLMVAFLTIERLRTKPQRAFATHISTPSDPRSPPAR